jgi:hypothetical protein
VTDSASLGIDEYRALLDEVFDLQIVKWTAEAEAAAMKPDYDGYAELIGERPG